MYICVYIYILYVYIYILYVYVYLYVYTYIFLYVYVYINVYIYIPSLGACRFLFFFPISFEIGTLPYPGKGLFCIDFAKFLQVPGVLL